MHWCPEPGCDYGSMQRSNLRNHIRKQWVIVSPRINVALAGTHPLPFACSTGQRLQCPDDSTCNYATFDKSALLRHRQRRHGYQTKPTASKDRCMKVTEKRRGTTRKQDNPSIDRSPNSHSEPVIDLPCPCPAASTSDRRAHKATDERDLWRDDHDSPQETVTEQPVEPIEESPDGHVTSRFPVSFIRTRLPHATGHGAPSASKHCRRYTCNLRSNSVLATYSNSTRGPDTELQSHRGAKVKEVFMYRHAGYPVKEAVFLATW
jgi:hypothetical protein